jgi:predicted nucleic-acid-binding protein
LRGIDTNILVRILLRDDPLRLVEIDALVDGGGLFVPLTVLIETEWVLRAVYKLNRERVNSVLFGLTRIAGIAFEDHARVVWACERHADGADFADMIHVLACRDQQDFLTLDGTLARHAGHDAPTAVAILA